MEVKRDILWRVYLSFIGITVLGLVILGRAFYIQRVQGDYWVAMSDSLHQRIQQLDAERGTIYSGDREMLSTSLPYFDIYIDFKADGLIAKNGKVFKENVDSFAWYLADHFKDQSKAAWVNELKSAYKKGSRYYSLKKKISFSDYKALREFPLARLGRNKSGIIVEVGSRRENPYGLLANRTIGLARSNAQNVGLENTYDSLLSGQQGQRLVRFIAGGASIPVEGAEIEPENGKDVITTIDVDIQDITETALLRKMTESSARYGTCVVMETKTGKIKAIANLGKQKDGSYWEDYNYALSSTEPGSTIKLATLLAVLSEGKMDLSHKVNVGSTGRKQVGPRIVTDHERSNSPVLSLKQCFAQSSNVGMGEVAFENFGKDPEAFTQYLHRFHLDQRTGIDLKGEGRPVIPKLKRDKGGRMDMITMAFGYALNVSPLQVLSFYNAMANDGKMMKPYLVDRIENNGVVVKQFSPTMIDDRMCSPDVVAAAKECMEEVVKSGTAVEQMKGLPFKVAGKTGTAHVSGKGIKYDDGIYQATFVGYFPADDPQYSCIVTIRTEPHALYHYGGQLGAPVFREIATKLYARYVDEEKWTPAVLYREDRGFEYAGYTSAMKKVYKELGVKLDDKSADQQWSRAVAENNQPLLVAQKLSANQMPDVKGMGLKDALFLLEERGLTVNIRGKGKVKGQSVEPGTAVTKNTEVWLDLKSD